MEEAALLRAVQRHVRGIYIQHQVIAQRVVVAHIGPPRAQAVHAPREQAAMVQADIDANGMDPAQKVHLAGEIFVGNHDQRRVRTEPEMYRLLAALNLAACLDYAGSSNSF